MKKMKKHLLLLGVLFIALNSWSQINTLPENQSFDAAFTTGTNVEFIPNWTGNDVQPSARIFRDEVDFNTAPAAMSIVPTGSFNGDVRISLDLTTYSEVKIDLLAKSVLNGTGDRSAILTMDTSIDGGTNWIGEEIMGSFPNETQANFTTISYSLPGAADNQNDVIVRLRVTRSAGGGTTAKLVIDDVEIFENAGSNQMVLVHYWNFNDNSSEAAITTVTQSLVAGASLNAVPGGTSFIDFAGGTGQNFDVENLNARNDDEAGTHLRFNDPIGGGLRFDMPTTGYENVVVKFATRRSGQGAGTQVWSYSIDGVNYIPFQNVISLNADPQLVTLDFTSIEEVNDNPDFSLLVEFEEGAGGTGGNNRFDNFTLDATPLESTPLLIASAGSLTFNQTLGAPSDEQTLVVSGINLTGDISINAPVNFEISLTSGAGFSSNLNIPEVDGTVTDTDVFVRLNNSEAGLSSGDLIISSNDADDVIVSLDGTTMEPTILVHYWNFNDNSSEAAITTVTQSLVAGASLNAVPGGTSFIDFAGGTGQNFNVENLNARNGDVAGTHLRFNDPIGGGLQFDMPTTGYENVVVKFATRRSGQGAGTQIWSYSIDGVNYIPFQNVITFNANPQLVTLDFSSIEEVNDNPDFSLLVEFEEGAGGTGGNNRFDNFTLDATPMESTPLLIASAGSLTFNQTLGAPSDEQTLVVSGINLADDITINAPANFEISLTSGAGFGSNVSIPEVDGTVIDTDVFVRLNNNEIGLSSGDLIISSTDADDVLVNLEGNTIEINISNPTPFVLDSGNYTFTEWDENSPAGTYPANMVFWTHATTDPDINVEFIEDWNCLYNLSNRSRINGEGENGFSFVNTGNSQYTGVCDGTDPDQSSGSTIENGRSGAAVLALNTVGTQNIIVEWTGRTIEQNNRVYAFRMQYRIGDGNGDANADWQDFDTPVEYISGAAGDSQSFTTPLPEVLENEEVVQLRWVYYYVSGSGSRAQIALDDITVSQAADNPLIIANPGSLSFSQTLGAPSAEQTLVVSADNLIENLSLDAPADFEISLTSGSGFTNSITLTQNNGVVEETDVFVRFNRDTEGTSTGELLISSLNATTVSIALEGTATIAMTSNPAPFVLDSGNYSFTDWDENSPAGTYPANMVFWTHATTDPDLNVEFIEDWSCLYNLTNRSRINGEGENGFSFVNTGNAQYTGVCDGSDPDQNSGSTIENGRSGAAVLALNTVGTQNIIVEWTGRTIAQNNRVYALRMQYRIGNGNGNPNIDWQDFDTAVEYISGATGDSQSFTTLLPETLENEEIVQLRWVYYYVSGSGSRAQIALGNITVIQASGDPLIIANPNSLNFSQIVGTPSAEQTLVVSGNNLDDDLSLDAPDDFEISLTSGSGFTNSLTITENNGVVEETNVFVRFNRETEGISTGNLLISTLNAATVAIALEGTAAIALTSNPAPFDLDSNEYSFTGWDENSPAGTYPTSMIFWTHATTDPDLETEFIEDWNCLYNLTSRSRISGEGENGFSFVNTGNAQFTGVCDGSDPDQSSGDTIENGRSGAAVLALNTTNRTDIGVLWTARTIAENNRVYALRMQYRIGTGNGNPNIDWQDFDTPIEYISGMTGDNEDFTVFLPESCEDQPVVQLRWVYYFISGSGSRAQIALDDIAVFSTSLSVNDFENQQNKFIFYPNPASDVIHFKVLADISVYDVLGKKMMRANNTQKLNVESLKPGVYFIRNEKGQTAKLIKK